MKSYNTIPWAWFSICRECLQYGREYTIQRGSYVGQKRRQLDLLIFKIVEPWTRPLGITHRNMAVSDDRSIEKYFTDYLINPEVPGEEQYTYGERIHPQLETIADILKDTPNTNQTSISIARPEDIGLPDPPCLREITWMIVGEALQLISYWRSWDLHVGMPTNAGGLQLLNELMAEWVGLRPGPLVFIAANAHIYDHSWGMI